LLQSLAISILPPSLLLSLTNICVSL
jgi:hypothetical protein